MDTPRPAASYPTKIYKPSLEIQSWEIGQPYGSPEFTHTACQHLGRCSGCGNIHQHTNSIIIAVDGACRGNGQANTRSAIGVYFREGSLSNRGLVMPPYVNTNQMAELHAAKKALDQMEIILTRDWLDYELESLVGDLQQVVIKSDSEYLVKGMTEWVFKWQANGWKTAKGQRVVNETLFRELQDRCNRLEDNGIEVMFWHVGRASNVEADQLANDALDGKLGNGLV